MINLLFLRIKLFIVFFISHKRFDHGPLKQKNIYLFLGADYGNLGDVAITYAQIKYLKEFYENYNVVEIPISQTFAGIKTIKKIIKKDDVIVLIGGGNTSDLYDDIEFLRQLVIWNFRKYRIIGFPQTAYFSASTKGKICRKMVHWIYSKAKYLTIMAREENTEQIFKKELKKIDICTAPDIVMTLNKHAKTERKGVLVCMRSDKESNISVNEYKQLISKLKSKFEIVDYQDTQVGDVNAENRYQKLDDVIAKFQNHELVITDRLHGMILSFITGTPALFYDNANHKISACFKWISDCGYIAKLEDMKFIDLFSPIDNFEVTHNRIIKKYNEIECLKYL